MTSNSRRRARRLIGAAAALGLAAAAHAAPVYSHVQPGAQVDFQATQMGVPMKGHFGSVTAQVHFAPQDLKASRVEFSVATASVDAGSGQTDELLRGPDWLDAKADPQARFVSSAFQPDGPGRYWVSGEFTVRGKTHPLRVLVRTQPSGKSLLMQSDFKLERSAYGLGGGSWADTGVVAADIAVHVQLLAQP